MASPSPQSSTPTPAATSTRPTSTSTSGTPAVSIAPNAHLDPACYVKGSYPLTISAGTIVHPRCRLSTDRGPITISQNCLLSERCVLGIDKDLNPEITSPNTDTINSSATLDGSSQPAKAITIGPATTLHSTVKLQPPSTISEGCILEAGVTLAPGCVIGAHSKVCAGIKLPPNTVVPEWMVVYGLNGQMRRRRRRGSLDGSDGRLLVEETRLEALGRERAGAEMLLKMNATKGLASAGGGSVRKRESVAVKSGG